MSHDPFYATTAWRRLRAIVLAEEPLCRACKREGKVRAATVVDHVKPRREAPELELDFDNCAPLCASHHSAAKQAEERRGYSDAIDEGGYPIDPRHPANG